MGSTVADSEEVVLVDDSLDSCVTTGVPPLPELPVLDLGVSAGFVPRLLVVCELLHTFASALKLKRKLNVGELLWDMNTHVSGRRQSWCLVSWLLCSMCYHVGIRAATIYHNYKVVLT